MAQLPAFFCYRARRMRRSDFAYDLPVDLIAQHPPLQRAGGRLLHVPLDHALRDLRFTVESIENAKPNATPEAMAHMAKVTLDTKVGDIAFYKGTGCDACGGSGLKGRQGLYEVMYMTPELRKCVLQNVGAAEIKDAAIAQGMLTLRMDGWLKVMKGICTMEQVIRETSADPVLRHEAL